MQLQYTQSTAILPRKVCKFYRWTTNVCDRPATKSALQIEPTKSSLSCIAYFKQTVAVLTSKKGSEHAPCIFEKYDMSTSVMHQSSSTLHFQDRGTKTFYLLCNVLCSRSTIVLHLRFEASKSQENQPKFGCPPATLSLGIFANH